jgi:hypothetical protein
MLRECLINLVIIGKVVVVAITAVPNTGKALLLTFGAA